MRAPSEGGERTAGRRPTRRPVRGAFSSLLLVLAVCTLVLCGYQTASGRWHATPVLSGSMRPGLQPGDIVITHRVPISDLRVRDVIVFHPPDKAHQQTVHRIVKLRVRNGTTVITTRGDANTIVDPTVTALSGATAYRVVRIVPLVGYPAVWLSGGHHGLLVIGLGILLLIVAALTLLRPETRRKESRAGAEDGGEAAPVAVPSEPEVAGDWSASGRYLLEVGTARHRGHSETGCGEQRVHEPMP
jgi:signal peptidase